MSPAQPTLVTFSTYMIITATLVSSWIQVLRSASFPLYTLNVHTLHLHRESTVLKLLLNGVCSCTLNIGLCRTFRLVFTIANDKPVILLVMIFCITLALWLTCVVMFSWIRTHIFLFMAFFLTPLCPLQALFNCSWTLLTATSPSSLCFLY